MGFFFSYCELLVLACLTLLKCPQSTSTAHKVYQKNVYINNVDESCICFNLNFILPDLTHNKIDGTSQTFFVVVVDLMFHLSFFFAVQLFCSLRQT